MSPRREKIVCRCLKVTEAQVVEAIQSGCCTLGAVARCTGAGAGCTSCHPAIRKLLERHAPAVPAARAPGVSLPCPLPSAP